MQTLYALAMLIFANFCFWVLIAYIDDWIEEATRPR